MKLKDLRNCPIKLSRYFLNLCSMPGTMLGISSTGMNKKVPALCQNPGAVWANKHVQRLFQDSEAGQWQRCARMLCGPTQPGQSPVKGSYGSEDGIDFERSTSGLFAEPQSSVRLSNFSIVFTSIISVRIYWFFFLEERIELTRNPWGLLEEERRVKLS